MYQKGVDQGGRGKVLQFTRKAIVIKWPAHKMNPGMRGMGQEYFPASISVYAVLENRVSPETNTGEVVCTEVIDWESTRGGPQWPPAR